MIKPAISDIEKDMDSLCDYVNSIGQRIDIGIIVANNDASRCIGIRLDKIYVFEKDRKMGYGTDIISRLKAIGTKYKVPIGLTPAKKADWIESIGYRRLVSFYETLGFRFVKHESWTMEFNGNN